MDPFDFSWMHGRRMTVSLLEPTMWVFSLGEAGAISVECPWRLIQDGRIAVSCEDHGQMYGRESPVDAGAVASSALADRAVTSASVRGGTADLVLHFGESLRLEIFPFSSGYESWSVTLPDCSRVVAQGGGDLCTW